MTNSISRVLIETIVRKTLRDIEESPERSTRNLVDMALQFSNGRFQKYFLETARGMLENENSAYYALVRDAVGNIDHERLLNFGMNVGYNSCTSGARRIREWERKNGYHVPWAVYLEVGQYTFQKAPNRYLNVNAEGEQMGVFTWFLFVENDLKEALRLAEEFPDSAFFVFCTAEMITEQVIDKGLSLDNVAFMVLYDENADEICAQLRQEKMLYGLYTYYKETDIEEIENGTLFESAQQLHPAAIVLIADPGCTDETQKRVEQLTLEARNSQKYQTIVWELQGDANTVEEIISGASSFAYFDRDGDLCGMDGKKITGENALFHQSLQTICMNQFSESS